MVAIGADESDVGRIGSQELNFGGAVVAGADHTHLLVGDLVAIAHRAIAQQPAGQCLVVELFVDAFRPVVDYPGGEQDAARAIFLVLAADDEPRAVPLQIGHPLGLTHRAIFSRLLAHPVEQILAVDAFGKAGVVVAGRDHAGPARAAVEQADLEIIARQIDRGG